VYFQVRLILLKHVLVNFNTRQVSDFMKHSTSREANSCAANYEIFHILWNLDFNYSMIPQNAEGLFWTRQLLPCLEQPNSGPWHDSDGFSPPVACIMSHTNPSWVIWFHSTCGPYHESHASAMSQMDPFHLWSFIISHMDPVHLSSLSRVKWICL
jgi:hypothetical protein